MSLALKTVPIKMNYCGKEVDREVGYYIRKRPVSTKEGWEDGPDDEVIFGVVYRGYVSHMSYGILVCGIESWTDFAVTGKHPRKFSDFYFDAGGNGRPLYATYNDLREALVRLELIPEEAIQYCRHCLHSKLVHDGTGGECQKIADEDNTVIQYCDCAGFQNVSE